MMLGPFQLDGLAGKGGMGVVWRGHHATTGLDVAVKLFGPSAGVKRDLSLSAEVRALAALNHPVIVRLLDVGQLPEPLAGLEESTPYIVEEWAGGGELSSRDRRAWPEVHRGVARLLDALAHAHAAGVLHRDLKPSNVLLGPELQWRLTDFGISRLRGERPESGEVVAGTPPYMAPEQIRGDWRGEGPWTDLYALGCLVWAMVCGGPPFSGWGGDVLQAHLSGALPRFSPVLEVPTGLEDWLKSCLDRDPQDRWRFAADAAAAWARLGDVKRAASPAPPEHPDGEPVSEPLTWILTDRVPIVPAQARPNAPRPPPRPPAPVAPCPADEPLPAEILDAGVGIVAWRRLPLLGRRDERAGLWSALQDIRARRGLSSLALEGPPGVGRSALLRWLGEAAHWTGNATPLWINASGPAAALLEANGLGELGAEEVARRLDWVPLPAEGALIALVKAPDDPPRLVARRFVDALATLGDDRPRLLLWDDWPGTSDALVQVEELLAAQDDIDTPTLLVLAPRDEAAAARMPPVDQRLRIGPLPDADLITTLDALVPLEASLRQALVDRCAGNPRLAQEIVLGLIDRGALLSTPHGYALRGEVPLPMPEDLISGWRARYEQALAGDEAARRALELAATWGVTTPAPTWSALRREVGGSEIGERRAPLTRAALVEIDDHGGISLPHVLAREALLSMATEAGRLPIWSAACAAVMAGSGRGASWEALGQHLLNAGAHERALEPLRHAIEQAMSQGAYPRGLELIRRREAALDALGRPPDDPQRIVGWASELRALRVMGRLAECEALATRRMEHAREQGDLRLQIGLLVEHAQLAQGRGEHGDAVRQLREARALAQTTGEPRAQGMTAFSLAALLRHLGQREEAERLAEELVALAERAANRRGLRVSLRLLAEVRLGTEREPQGLEALNRALEIARADGDDEEVSIALNVLGEFARSAGRVEEAAERYTEAIRSARTAGLPFFSAAALNLAQLHAEQERISEARALTRRALHASTGSDRHYVFVGARLILALCDLASGATSDAEAHLEEARAVVAATGLRDRDFVSVALGLARRADSLGRRALAETARQFALEQSRAPAPS